MCFYTEYRSNIPNVRAFDAITCSSIMYASFTNRGIGLLPVSQAGMLVR
jgi:hypothetical protein